MLNNQDIKKIILIVKEAGQIIMNYYHNYSFNVEQKGDNSPVTCADLEANNFICTKLKELFPNILIISEEDVSNHHLLDESYQYFWSIDPLDATRSFIKKNGEFTINIGLIKDSKPSFGIVYSPLSKKLYYTDEQNIAYRQIEEQEAQIIHTRAIPEEGATIVVSESSVANNKLYTYLSDTKINQIITFSSSLKMCLIAEGEADIYLRLGNIMEWDTAAAHAILNSAGGSIKDLAGNDLTYGHKEKKYYNPEFIALGNNR